MNTIVTSREEILKAARKLAITQGTPSLSMRAVAQSCGIAVGSIYNYFPTKADLTIAVVAEVWREIFHPLLCTGREESFLSLVDRLTESIRQGISAYPGFFAGHSIMVEDKEKGRAAMGAYFSHMSGALLSALRNDPGVRRDSFDSGLTAEDFVEFVLDFLRTDLLFGRERGALLRELIVRVVYGGPSAGFLTSAASEQERKDL